MKSMPWFRFYSETADDVKFKFLSRTLKMPVFSVIGIWAILECRASQSPQRGYLYVTTTKRYTVDDIADELNIDPETCGAIIDAFCEMEMLDVQAGVIHLTNWEKRQYASDNSTERVNRFREKKAAEGDCNVSETLPVTPSSASVSAYDSVSESVSESDAFTENPFSAAFVQASAIMPHSLDKWSRALDAIQKTGAISEDVTTAVQELRERGYNISGPWSIQNAVIMAKGKRENASKPAARRNGKPTLAEDLQALQNLIDEEESKNGNH